MACQSHLSNNRTCAISTSLGHKKGKEEWVRYIKYQLEGKKAVTSSIQFNIFTHQEILSEPSTSDILILYFFTFSNDILIFVTILSAHQNHRKSLVGLELNKQTYLKSKRYK